MSQGTARRLRDASAGRNTEEGWSARLPHVRRVAPALAALRVIRTWSGIEGYMDDDIPVIGPSAKVPGLFYAFGFCGHGFQLGPGVGDAMAELIDSGRRTTPIDAFGAARFARKAS